MRAMVLAAGLGTRLRPLTDHRPKALMEVAGRTLLEIALARLASFGIREVIVNVHHFADMIVDYLKANKNFGMRIEISREDDVLLDTGGGLKKAAHFFLQNSQSPEEPFILHNVDVISTIDLSRMLQFHTENHALATLAVQDRETSRYLLFDDQLHLCGRRSSGTLVPSAAEGATPVHPELRRGCAPQVTPTPNAAASAPEFSRRRGLQPPRNAPQAKRASAPEVPNKQDQRSLLPLAFSGIHVISPGLLPMLTEEGIFSIIASYLRLVALGEKILAFRADDYYWRDLGTPDNVMQAAQELKQNASL
jgi:NDP-sugar pyrophosphorylase family protein